MAKTYCWNPYRLVVDEVLVQVSIASWVAQSTSINAVNTLVMAKIKWAMIRISKSGYDLWYKIFFILLKNRLKLSILRNPIYSETAACGHKGRKLEIVEKNVRIPCDGKRSLKSWILPEKMQDYVTKAKKAFWNEITLTPKDRWKLPPATSTKKINACYHRKAVIDASGFRRTARQNLQSWFQYGW